MQPSPWLTDPIASHPPLDRDLRVDVVVVGAGITGVTAAYMLQARGLKVALLDRGHIGGGDTGHTTAHLASVTDRPPHDLQAGFGDAVAAKVWDAGMTAIDEIARMVADLGVDAGFARVPGYLHVRPGHARAAQDARVLRHGCDGYGPLEITAAWDDHVPLFATPGIRFEGQARFRPQAYLQAMAAAVKSAGGAVHEHTAVEGIEGTPFEVRAGQHWVTAPRVVLATHTPLQGAAGSFGTLLSQLRIAMYTSYAVRAIVDKGRLPDALWWDTVDPYRYVRLDPGDAHDYLIVGGGDHKTGQQVDAAARYAELERVVQDLAPGATVDYRWSGQVVEPSDGLPFIGESAECQFSATGYAGNGMTFGTLAGMMAADWAVGTPNPFADVFSWQRTGLAGGGIAAVLSENVDYPARKVRDALVGAADDTAHMPIGSGRVVDIDGQAAAVYRKQDGTFARHLATCTHMGCRVVWNEVERTWDCPCHGSRFAPDGDVISGPAEQPLDPLPAAEAPDGAGRTS